MYSCITFILCITYCSLATAVFDSFNFGNLFSHIASNHHHQHNRHHQSHSHHSHHSFNIESSHAKNHNAVRASTSKESRFFISWVYKSAIAVSYNRENYHSSSSVGIGIHHGHSVSGGGNSNQISSGLNHSGKYKQTTWYNGKTVKKSDDVSTINHSPYVTEASVLRPVTHIIATTKPFESTKATTTPSRPLRPTKASITTSRPLRPTQARTITLRPLRPTSSIITSKNTLFKPTQASTTTSNPLRFTTSSVTTSKFSKPTQASTTTSRPFSSAQKTKTWKVIYIPGQNSSITSTEEPNYTSKFTTSKPAQSESKQSEQSSQKSNSHSGSTSYHDIPGVNEIIESIALQVQTQALPCPPEQLIIVKTGPVNIEKNTNPATGSTSIVVKPLIVVAPISVATNCGPHCESL